MKPGTKVEVLDPFVDLVDTVLIMTVEPGFGGQKFMADMMPKVSYMASFIFLIINFCGLNRNSDNYHRI